MLKYQMETFIEQNYNVIKELFGIKILKDSETLAKRSNIVCPLKFQAICFNF